MESLEKFILPDQIKLEAAKANMTFWSVEVINWTRAVVNPSQRSSLHIGSNNLNRSTAHENTDTKFTIKKELPNELCIRAYINFIMIFINFQLGICRQNWFLAHGKN